MLRERIDEGGFGAVYRCEQPLLGREAVVKVLHQRLRRNDTVLQRFMREAQLGSRLDHPYAAHVYAFGIEHDDGLFWIAMELVHGTALNRWLRERGPLSIGQLVPFFECVAEVVQTAHDRGIVHRDLKPSNVMVIERAGKLLPKLLDFGVAKLVDDGALPRPPRLQASGTQPLSVASERRFETAEAVTLTASTTPPQRHDLQHRLTHADSTIGSPPYMSPEQWTNAVTVGPSSDLYALAVIAYEALTGRRPFTASTITEYADLHCNAVVPPLGDGLPAALDRLFERALAKRPEQRWQSALELASALRSASRLGRPQAEVPGLDRSVRDAWLADAPQPLADLVAALDDASNLHHARDAARDLMRGLLRYLVALGLVTRAQVRDERDDPAVVELLRTMRQRDLAAVEHVRLLRLVVRPFVGRRGAHPIPELVDLVTPHSDGDTDDLDPLLAMQPPTDQPAVEDLVRSRLAELLPELTRVLRRMAFVLDYVLIVPRDEVVERWTGPRRRRRVLATVHAGELVKHHPMLLDRKGRVCVDLWPLAQVVSPTEGAEPRLFLFEGRGRHGARLIATPDDYEYYEHFDPTVWEWIAARVIADAAIRAEAGEDQRPYLGLAPYAVSDAVRFVGRESEVDGVLERLRHRPLQVVVGPSGAGKSSFVHAGVIPRLPRGWRAVTLRPGAAPLAALASRLGDAGVATAELRDRLVSAPATVAADVARAAESGTIAVVVDQLEELFTLCGCEEERVQFAAALAQLAASADLPVRVIATIRDDFLMQLEALPPLRALLSPALVLLSNPLRDDLVRIVVEPARRAGYTLSDPELANDMVSAVASRPGALALLSFTASRLWELRDRRFRQLTRSAYDAMGGVAGALVRHAEATFEALSADEQRLAREIFRHLVTADGARAQLTADELRQRLATPRAAAVIDKLIAARLLAMFESQTPGESHIEVIHDALLDGWPRLQRWVREDVDGARMRDQLRIAARQWADRGRPRSLVWRDGMLADLERWLRRGKTRSLTELEAAFVEASRRLARRARVSRRLGLVAIGFAVACAVFGYRTISIHIDESVLEHQLTQGYADWGQEALLDGRPIEALAYLHLAARRGDDSTRVRFTLARAAEPFQHEVARLQSKHGRMWWASYSPDGRRIVTTDDEGAQVWNAESRALELSLHHGNIVYQAAFTSNGARIITAGADGTVKVWDARMGQPIWSLRREPPSDVATYFPLAISPRGTEVAAIDSTGSVADIWDLNSGALIHELVGITGSRLEYSYDGRWLATSTQADVVVYNTTTWERLQIPANEVTTLSFDPTALRLATATGRGDVSIWSVPSGERQWHLHESGARVNHVAFSPDGTFVVATGQDGIDRIWNTKNGELHVELKNHRSASTWAEFDAHSRLVVSVDNDKELTITDVALRATVSTLDGPSGLIRAVHFDPQARHVVAASWDGTTRIWNTTRSYLRWATQPMGGSCGSPLHGEPDRRFVAVACEDRGTWVWDTQDAAGPRLLAQLPNPTPTPGDFATAPPAVSAAGDRAAIAMGNAVAIYELPGGRVLSTVHHGAPVTTVAFASSGHELVSGSVDGSVMVASDAHDPIEVARLPGAVDVAALLPGGRVVVADARPWLGVYRVARHAIPLAEHALQTRATTLRSSSDGQRLLAIPRTGAVGPALLWRLDEPSSPSWRLDTHNTPVISARFVNDDNAVLTGHGDGTARLWDAQTGRLRRSYLHGAGYVADVAFEPGGAFAVTAGSDGTLRFWDVPSGHRIWVLKAHQSAIIGVHFDGTSIVTRALSGEIARWELSNLLSSQELGGTLDRIVHCLPVRFDPETRGLVEQEQDPACDG